MTSIDEVPQSVEEAGALLGAAITRYDSGSHKIVSPPKGTHSSFATLSPVPSSELLVRLHSLRALLRSAPKDTPLIAAPSLLAGVLMKLLGISSSLAAAQGDPSRRVAIPPMLSTPLRRLWVDCVVLCHSLGEGLSGHARINIYGFVRSMITLAAMNPRSVKAGGGTRIAAMEVIGGVFEDPKLLPQLASWSLDVLQLNQRALKSSGSGEPTYRIAAVQTACSVALACREASIKLRPRDGAACLVLQGAMEEKAILEVIKLLRQASTDKFAEVRSAAASLAGIVAPVLIHNASRSSKSTSDSASFSPTTSLEDVMTIALKNLDDESPDVASGWAEALARCMSTAIQYCQQVYADNSSRRDVEGADSNTSAADDNEGSTRKQGTRKGVVSVSLCSNLPNAIRFLVRSFVKVGGELAASRGGGTYSIGGRAARLGYARTLVQLLRLQSKLDSIGETKGVSVKEAIVAVLEMVGSNMESQLTVNDRSAPYSESLDATSVVSPDRFRDTLAASNPLFGQAARRSHADGGIARMATNRVIRQGISELATEATQLTLLHEAIQLCGNGQSTMNDNQLQVLLVEISHLLVTLGEAIATSIEDIVPALKRCLIHQSHGVRHEAAVACAALTNVFPAEGRMLLQDSINDIQLQHAELMKLASTKKVETAPETAGPRLLRFRRTPTKKEVKVDDSLKHQYAIHGLSLMMSMVVRDLPNLPGGFPTDLLATVLSVAEILTSTLYNDFMTKGNPNAACTCVRAGYGVICGTLTTGPSAIAKHIALIFGLWQKTSRPSGRGEKFTSGHELICIDAMLSSIVAFLKYCSELLLSIPDALSRTSLILEELLPHFMPDGRLGTLPANPAAAARLQSAKASLMEAYAWLPPGSYPLIADTVFSFAAGQIQAAIEGDVTCSILVSLVNKEDVVLDAVSFSRAMRTGQVGGAKDLEQDIILLTSEEAHHGERESVLHFQTSGAKRETNAQEVAFRGSQVLGIRTCQGVEHKPPTPLHEVGTWRTPANPSCSSKVRLVDAAIQAFAATFGLKSGKEQQRAMQMLETLVPPIYYQLARAIGLTTTLTEHDRRAKAKEDCAAVANIIAIILSCLHTLPLHESTNNIPIGLGPPWMNTAKDLLLTLIPSASHIVRRAAAEGLALLATLGVTEDAHFLQSTVLHSLDEVMQGNQPDGKPRAIPFEPVSAARAGALLTLACIQRTAYNIQKQRSARSRGRGSGEEQLPTFQMMTRVLPSIACHGVRDYFSVRTYALHSFGLLFAYSNRLNKKVPNTEDSHLLKKGVELVEDNFLAAWTVASFDYDRGNEAEKLSSEPSFLSVILRLMTLMVPSLHHLKSTDPCIAARFSAMATLVLECHGWHPVVFIEAMAFFEVLAAHQQLLPPPSLKVEYSENPILCCIPFLMSSLTPDCPKIQPQGRWRGVNGCLSSRVGIRATLCAVKMLSISQVLIAEWSDMKIVSLLYAALEATCSTRVFTCDTFHRSLAAPRSTEMVYLGGDSTERELVNVLHLLLRLERSLSRKSSQMLLRWILLSRTLLVGVSNVSEDLDEDSGTYAVAAVVRRSEMKSIDDASIILEYANPVRWQVKAQAVQLATHALVEMADSARHSGVKLIDSPQFNPKVAQSLCSRECRDAEATGSKCPASFLALHLSDVISAACATSIATVDQSELQMLQESAMHMIVEVIKCFGRIPDPQQPEETLLAEYLPQISSCIKNSLVAFADRDGEVACRLFMVGCEALNAFFQTDLASEASVVKRLARGAMPKTSDYPFFAYDSDVPRHLITANDDKKHQNNRAHLLLRIGQMWTLGNLPLNDSVLSAELDVGKPEVGVHSAALAIDGACLLLGSNLSLCGIPLTKNESRPSIESGFFFENIMQIDFSVRSALVKAWASCGCSAVRFLSESISAKDTESVQRDACKIWLRNIVSFLFEGLHHAISGFKDATSLNKSAIDWARNIDASDVAASCIKGLTLMVESDTANLNEDRKSQLDRAITVISEFILQPLVCSRCSDDSEEKHETLDRKGQNELARVCCDFIQSLANKQSAAAFEGSALLVALLKPLDRLQSDSITFGGEADEDEGAVIIISVCLISIASMVSHSKAPSSFVRAMLQLALSVEKKSMPKKVATANMMLLKACLGHDAVSLHERSRIMTDIAKTGNWESWASVYNAVEGAGAQKSLEIVQSVLLGSKGPVEQRTLLTTLLELLQSQPIPSPSVGRVVFTIGPEVMCILQAYGTLNVPKEDQLYRTEVCSGCMKIILLTLQQVVSELSEDDLVPAFFTVMFDSLLAVLRFNGLPNHPPPQGGSSDPALGRMCAQAILHVARTAAVAFKSCMSGMPEHDRTVLEFAVRAEMSGYATATTQAPAKKKLNLQGFKK